MNSEQAKLLAMTGIGERIKHQKGGIYTVIGFCRVQINGQWEDGIQYGDGRNNYVRLVSDCERLHSIS